MSTVVCTITNLMKASTRSRPAPAAASGRRKEASLLRFAIDRAVTSTVTQPQELSVASGPPPGLRLSRRGVIDITLYNDSDDS